MTTEPAYPMMLFRFIGTYIIILVFLFIHNPILTGIVIAILIAIADFFSTNIHYNTIIEIVRLFTKEINFVDFIIYLSVEILGGYLAVKTHEYFNHK